MGGLKLTITETPVAGGYEQRYSISLGSIDMPFVRRPVSILPEDGTICYADCGPRYGVIPRQAVAIFKGGKWKRLKFEPTHWTHWDS
jgi:hypothetical protein